jgi:uncharacterized protein
VTDTSKDGPEVLADVSPYLKLTIDKDGRWFQNGAEIIHPEVYRYFNQLLESTPEGTYRIRTASEICCVEVEDAPFVVQTVLDDPSGPLRIQLNDDSVEVLKPQFLWIGANNVPYALVKDERFHARFSRQAYYMLAEHIVSDEREEDFYVEINGDRSLIGHQRPKL